MAIFYGVEAYGRLYIEPYKVLQNFDALNIRHRPRHQSR